VAQRDGVAGLQLVGDLVVGSDDRLGPVPGAPVGLVDEHGRQRRVGRVPAGEGFRLEHTGAHQRMPEGHPHLVEAQQPGRGGAVQGVDVHPPSGQDRGGGEDFR